MSPAKDNFYTRESEIAKSTVSCSCMQEFFYCKWKSISLNSASIRNFKLHELNYFMTIAEENKSSFYERLQNCQKLPSASSCLSVYLPVCLSLSLSICPSNRHFAWKNSAPTGWIFMKIDI